MDASADHHRRRAEAHERAAAAHGRAAGVHDEVADFLDDFGRTERALRHRQQAAENRAIASEQGRLAAEELVDPQAAEEPRPSAASRQLRVLGEESAAIHERTAQTLADTADQMERMGDHEGARALRHHAQDQRIRAAHLQR